MGEHRLFQSVMWCLVLLLVMLITGGTIDNGETRPPERSGNEVERDDELIGNGQN